MLSKKKQPAAISGTLPTTEPPITTQPKSDSDEKPLKQKKVKKQKPRQREKCENCKRCWGFCDFLKTSWKLFKEFSADTSIHGEKCEISQFILGIKYLTDKKRHWSEKLFWFVALTLSILACSYLIYDTFRKWKMAPVIVSFSEKFMNIWEIPFPAVTICPIAGLYPLDEDYNPSDGLGSNPLKNFTESIEHRITNAKWRNNLTNATDLFTEIATEEGFCYTFNMMNFHDLLEDDVKFEGFKNLKNYSKVPKTSWSLQDGYYNKKPKVYPYRASGSGENGGLKFEIWRRISEVKKSTSFNKGFKLVVHLPSEVPQFDKHYYRFPLEKSATLVVRPSLIVTENLESYESDLRQCYYEGEKKLKFFKYYTRSNCQLECLANFTRDKCSCIHFSMPRLKGDAVCDSNRSLTCFDEAKKNLMQKTMEESLQTSTSYDDRGRMTCDCLPACTSLQYEGEISHDDIRYFGRYKTTDAFRSSVTIFFKDDDFIFSKRSELYSFTDFIANFGGILGLFLGVSILSIVEIIYFVAFRKLDDDSEESEHESQPQSIGGDTTIASVEIKADETIVRNGY
ncbi:CLUMA_CG015356, isoform A [Clunio marinus]|uniref:CLUMA_CG015356, isoform A n=1 Tax=Clunio marinus TaxID=568069 RepID=A0A1J1IQU3_9DIPT|nr:CLUMA_CG015356, isoform A [Clunio marinus]